MKRKQTDIKVAEIALIYGYVLYFIYSWISISALNKVVF